MVATLTELAPLIFATKTKSGTFKCSMSYVRKFLDEHMNWVLRRATRAAQKLPADAEAQCRVSFLRQALSTLWYRIPPELRINIDQLQIILQALNERTYEYRGSRQVAIVGQEEKRAFTLLVGVAACGFALPFQAIWKGKSQASLPSQSSPGYHEAVAEIGMRFVVSKTDTYWSTQDTMQLYIEDIVVPYFNRKRRELGLPPDARCILQLDAWSVHRSQSFGQYMVTTWPWIIRDFVPGGCTGIWQPCDVGIQRFIKASIRRSQHEDIVAETTALLKSGVLPRDIRLDTTLATLRNRSVQWLVQAYHDINDARIIKKVCLTRMVLS